MAVKDKKENIKTAIRADGGHAVGFGHLSRCSSLAKAISRRMARADISFWCRQSAPAAEFLAREGFEPHFFNMPEDFQNTRDLLWKFAPHILIMDMAEHIPENAFDDWTAINREYSLALSASSVISVQLDDFADGDFNASLVVNGGVVDEYTNYKGSVSGELLCGPKYVLLRPEFTKAAMKLREFTSKIETALIVDCGNTFTARIPHFIAALETVAPAVKVKIVSKALIASESKPKTNLQVEYIPAIQDMAEAMVDADVAFTGGGTILYELAASGTPAVSFPAVDHQIPISKKFAEIGTVVDVGPEADGKAILDAVGRLSWKDIRKQMSDAGRSTVDGMGADRVAAKIMEMLSGRLSI